MHNVGMSVPANILSNAGGPKSVTSDGQNVTAHSLQDQIAADKYLRGLDAAKKKRRPFRLMRTMPGSAVGGGQ